MIYAYPPEVEEFVKKWAPKLRDRELAALCNERLGTAFTAGKMKAYRGNHGIRNYLPKHYAGEEYWKHQTRWPQGMYEYVRDNSWGVSSKDMAERVNEKFGTSWTPTGMKQFRQKWGIKSGVTGWYQKGRAPGTKGKTIEEICGHDPEKLARVRSTQFKPGTRPPNELPIGSVVINDQGYKLVKKKTTGTQWERWGFLHLQVWEDLNGPVPEGHVVAFKDGDRLNCDPDNLMLVTKEELPVLVRRGWRFRDPEMTTAALNVIRLENALAEKRGPKNPQGPELRAKREQAGLTAREMAEKLGVSVQTVKRIEKGDAVGPSKALQAYVRLMGEAITDGSEISARENHSQGCQAP